MSGPRWLYRPENSMGHMLTGKHERVIDSHMLTGKHERMWGCHMLTGTHERVIDRTITVRVIPGHRVASYASTFDERSIWAKTLLMHIPNNSAVNWL